MSSLVKPSCCSLALPHGSWAPSPLPRQGLRGSAPFASQHRFPQLPSSRRISSSPGFRRRLRASASASVATNPKFGSQMLVIVPPHPLIKHWVAILRSASTPPSVFRNAMSELGRLLIYEAARDWLPTIQGDVETPCGIAQAELVDPSEPIAVVPILRAGIVLGEQAATTIPHSVTYHLGMVRNEETLQPSFYLSKLPETIPPDTRVLVLDCMLATGGTIVAAIEAIVARGADPRLMRVVSAIAAPPALKRMSEKFPGLKVYTGIIDPDVNDKGFIVPGLGDAGDRCFGTL